MNLAFIFTDVGAGEWLVLLAVILVVMGPKRLPETARKFGQYYAKFRRAAESFKRQLLDMDSDVAREVKAAVEEVKSAADEVNEAFRKEIDEITAPPEVPAAPVDAASSPRQPATDAATAAPVDAASSPRQPATAAEPEKPKWDPKAIKITVSPAPQENA